MSLDVVLYGLDQGIRVPKTASAQNFETVQLHGAEKYGAKIWSRHTEFLRREYLFAAIMFCEPRANRVRTACAVSDTVLYKNNSIELRKITKKHKNHLVFFKVTFFQSNLIAVW